MALRFASRYAIEARYPRARMPPRLGIAARLKPEQTPDDDAYRGG